MSRRTLPLILILFVFVAALVGYLLLPSSDENRSGAPSAAGSRDVAQEESAALEGGAAPAELEEADAVVTEEAEREALDLAAQNRQKLRADASSRWIEGKLVFPEGLPDDERALVLALSESMKLRALYRDSGPARHAWEGRECHGLIDWAEVSRDGSFRLAVPNDQQEVHLGVTGRYLYSRSTKAVVSTATNVTLSAELGAWITGTLVAPRGVEVSLKNTEVELGPDITAGFNAFEVQELAVTMETEADAAGSFEFRGVSDALAHGIVARPEELAAARQLGIRPKPGEHFVIDVSLPHGATLTGRVIDESGAPVGGADVSAAFRGPLGQAIGALRETEADDSGEFVLNGVAPGKLEVRAEHASFRRAKIKVSEDEARDGASLSGLELVMETGGSISGRVSFEGGAPAPDVSVNATPDMSQLGSMGGLGAVGIDWESRDTTTTDADGRFTLRGLADGLYQVRARLKIDEGEREGTWSATLQEVKPGDTGLDLVLAALLEIDGIVQDQNGEPVTDFTVTATLEGSGGMFGIGAERRRQDFIDEEGHFELGGLELGTWKIVVSAEGFATSETLTVALPSAETMRITIGRAAMVTGEVHDTGGRPVSGAKVAIKLDLAGRMAAMQAESLPEAYSDSEGKFLLTNLDPGSLQIAASLPGYAASEAYACEAFAGEVTEGVVLRLRMGGRLSGQILDDTGEPDAGRMVIVQKSPDFSAQHMLTSDAQGKFEAEHLEPGTWQVVATGNFLEGDMEFGGEDSQDAMAEFLGNMKMDIVQIVDGEETFVLLGAPPANPVTVRGQVTHAGEPLSSAIVSFVPEGADGIGAMKMKFTDEAGDYEVELEKPGNYLVTAQLTSEMGMQNSVEFSEKIEEGDDFFQLDIEMPLGVITGRVRGPGGKPAGGCRVTLTVEGGHALGSMMGGHYTETATDDEGYYELSFLRPGTYTVAVGGVPFGGLLGGESAGGRVLRQGIEVGEGEHKGNVDFELQEPGKIVGQIVDGGGNPVAGAAVFVRGEEGQMLDRFSMLTSDAGGHFVYESVAPGRYSVFAKKEGQASSESELVRVSKNGQGEVTLMLEPGGYVLVSVIDENDEDVRARIQVVDPEGRAVEGMLSLEDMMSLAQGFSSQEQRIGPLTPGTYKVTATADDGRSYTKPVNLKAGAERKLKIRLK